MVTTPPRRLKRLLRACCGTSMRRSRKACFLALVKRRVPRDVLAPSNRQIHRLHEKEAVRPVIVRLVAEVVVHHPDPLPAERLKQEQEESDGLRVGALHPGQQLVLVLVVEVGHQGPGCQEGDSPVVREPSDWSDAVVAHGA